MGVWTNCYTLNRPPDGDKDCSPACLPYQFITSAKERMFSVQFVSLSAGLRKIYGADLHDTWWRGVGRAKEEPIKCSINQSQIGIMVHDPLIIFHFR